jgi:hypothetical protein
MVKADAILDVGMTVAEQMRKKRLEYEVGKFDPERDLLSHSKDIAFLQLRHSSYPQFRRTVVRMEYPRSNVT